MFRQEVKISSLFTDELFTAKVYFKGIKFRGFRGFRKNREIKSRRKIGNWPSAKLNPHEKNKKIRLIREIFFKNKRIQSLFDTKRRPFSNFSNVKIIVVS